MDMDNFIEKWSKIACKDSVYGSGTKYQAIMRLLKEKSLKEKMSDEPRLSHLYLKVNGNSKYLSNHRLNDNDVKLFLLALEEITTPVTVSIELRYNNISDEGAALISKFLESDLCPIVSLDLSYNDLSESGAVSLSQSLQLNSTVQKLSLRGNKLGTQGGIQVASMLQVNQTVQSVDIAETDLSSDVLVAMATVLHGNQYVECLDLSRPLLHSRQEETIVHLSEMLRINSTLTTLHLSKHGLTDSGLEVLCRGLRENSTIANLNLSCNKISRDGACALAKFLSRNPPLKELDLSCNRIEDEGMDYISTVLSRSNMTLRRLNVCYNSINDEALKRLADAVERNYALTDVYIWGNDTGREASKAFQKLLKDGRMNADNIDVQAYEVDGVVHLAKYEISN